MNNAFNPPSWNRHVMCCIRKVFFKLGITVLADEQVRLVSTYTVLYVQFVELTIGIFEAVDILQTLNKQISSIILLLE